MGFEWKRKARVLAAVTAAAAALITGGLVAGSANAAQKHGLPGYWVNPYTDGSHFATKHGEGLGPVAGQPGDWIYCVQAGVNDNDAGRLDGTWEPATSPDQKTAAWMIDATKNDASDDTQAAVAYAIHEHIEEGTHHWAAKKKAGLEGADINAIAAKANELWAAAQNKVVSSSGFEQVKYTRGLAQGTVQAWMKDANGNYVNGVPYQIVYDNNVINVSNPTGVTNGGPIDIDWTAVNNGDARIHVQYDMRTLKKLVPKKGQTKVGGVDPMTANTADVQFKVVRSMKPTIVSDATGEYADGLTVGGVVHAEKGDHLSDKATIGAQDMDGDGQPDWLTGTNGKNVTITATVNAYGPYTKEQADQYQGGKTPLPADAKPVATGTATTDKPGDVHVSTKDGTLKYTDGHTDDTLQ